MSFSSDLKKELCLQKIQNVDKRLARLRGLLLFSKEFVRPGMLFASTHAYITDLAYKESTRLFDGETTFAVSTEEKRGAPLYILNADESDKARLSGLLHLSLSNRLYEEKNPGELLAGAFLACGTLTDPKKSYQLEFLCESAHKAEALCELLLEHGVSGTVTYRQGKPIVYIKDSESVEDTVTLMGAISVSFEIMNIKIYKDFRNKANRITNCETANIDKMVSAAIRQTEAIRSIYVKKGKGYLTDELAAAAELRLSNPEASLNELLTAADFPVSRSGLNHRLRRLCELADKLNSKDG